MGQQKRLAPRRRFVILSCLAFSPSNLGVRSEMQSLPLAFQCKGSGFGCLHLQCQNGEAMLSRGGSLWS